MIPIVKPAAPELLLTKGVAATRELCDACEAAPADFRTGVKKFDFDHALYAAEIIKETLRNAQHRKCAFCESIFDNTGYGDIEHFRPKAGYKQRTRGKLQRPGYYWLAYDWENLFYSCQLCNQCFKGNHFPLKDGRSRARSHTHKLSKEEPLLIDPSRVAPAAFLDFRAEYAYAVKDCREGEITIEVLGLNREELVEVRRRRLRTLTFLLQLRDLLREKVAANPNSVSSGHLHVVEAELAASTQTTSEYAAMARAFLDHPAPTESDG